MAGAARTACDQLFTGHYARIPKTSWVRGTPLHDGMLHPLSHEAQGHALDGEYIRLLKSQAELSFWDRALNTTSKYLCDAFIKRIRLLMPQHYFATT